MRPGMLLPTLVPRPSLGDKKLFALKGLPGAQFLCVLADIGSMSLYGDFANQLCTVLSPTSVDEHCPSPRHSVLAGLRIRLAAMTSKLAVAVLAALNVLLLTGSAMAEAHRLVPPVKPACISSPFGPRILPDHPQAGTYHYGIDLPAPEGAPVLATAPGTVIRIQDSGPGGLEVMVQHDGFVGVYSHFGTVSPDLVDGKTSVAAGQKLGVVGKTGIIFGTHLYFEMIVEGKPVDPEPYLGVPPCNGETHRTVTARTDSNGVNGIVIGGRKYYMLLPPTPR